MKSNKGLLLASALLMASACSSGTGDENQAAPENVQAANDMAAMMNDPNNPFAQAEMQMNERMMAAVGADAGDTWVRKMIEHHRGAVEMSNTVLGQTQNADVRRMAQTTIDKQTREIQDLEKIAQANAAPSQDAATLYRPSEMKMHEQMMAATGSSVDEIWMRKMIEHHRGAVEMSDVVLAQNPNTAIRAKAEKAKADQQKEIQALEAMLRGEATPAANDSVVKASSKESAAPTKAPAVAAKQKAPEAEKSAPKPAPKAPEPADPHAGHDMNHM
ncbi:DUF305 domain-containing protein [Allosphingosinicella vermicomposti]|uniref:DUF305 domain-containing protein n=1 Tax=Allosphingosinicella vermicomposti TaxID=614671 RepID=UPI00131A507B|nr:DUF305 domain-containing protein [Allosphingosinicella vermicomposti]